MMTTLPIAARTCGPCRACCTLLAIPELEKPLRTPCKHECSEGCAIYTSPERPAVCGGFACEWLAGRIDGDDRLRPAELGVMFTTSEIAGMNQVLTAWETMPDAFDEPAAAYLLDKLRRKHAVVLLYHDGTAKLSRADMLTQVRIGP